MLQSLRIQNLALLDHVSVDFEAGFAAVTGETGAGKSILIGALSLLAGERVARLRRFHHVNAERVRGRTESREAGAPNSLLTMEFARL